MSGQESKGISSEVVANIKDALYNPEIAFLATVRDAVFAPELNTSAAKNFLLANIKGVLTKHGIGQITAGPKFDSETHRTFLFVGASLAEDVQKQRVQEATAEIFALLADPVSFELIKTPVLLDSGHTFDEKTVADLEAVGMTNPMTRQPLARAGSDEQAQATTAAITKIVGTFQAFSENISSKFVYADDENNELTQSDLPVWLYDEVGKRVRLLQPIINQASAEIEAIARELLAYFQAYAMPAVRVRRLSRLPSPSSAWARNVFLFLVFGAGATMTVFGLAGFVQGIYAPFMLFVIANGIGGSAMAGVLLAVGAILVIAAIAALLFPDRASSGAIPIDDMGGASAVFNGGPVGGDDLELEVRPAYASANANRLPIELEADQMLPLLNLLQARRHNEQSYPERKAMAARGQAAARVQGAALLNLNFVPTLLRQMLSRVKSFMDALADARLRQPQVLDTQRAPLAVTHDHLPSGSLLSSARNGGYTRVNASESSRVGEEVDSCPLLTN